MKIFQVGEIQLRTRMRFPSVRVQFEYGSNYVPRSKIYSPRARFRTGPFEPVCSHAVTQQLVPAGSG